MKFTTIITGLFAATAIAAPAAAPASNSAVLLSARSDVQPRTNFNKFDYNDFLFNNRNFGYFAQVNNIDFTQLLVFGQKHNFDISVFQSVFIQQQFDIKGLIQLHLAHQFLQIAQTGVFELFELSTLKLGGLDFGVQNNLFGIDLQQFVLQAQIETITNVGGQRFHQFGF